MDNELMVSNIKMYCSAKGVKPTPACIEAGVGRNFLIDIKRNRIPSVTKVADLAAYLGVTTSDLVGDARASPAEADLLLLFRQLNQEGQERMLDQADDMVRSGKYIKSGQDQLVPEKAN